VFEAGVTQRGRPYVAMELVRGTALTAYCDDHKLPPDTRLRLFIAVCRGVQHAHQKGVVHRDLKPSNILVTLHDGAPVPKIIDFGIAKATTGLRLTEKTLFTRFHAFVGTPVYTSPEQIEMSGADVDTRSDIYSLGVLLYELLAGRPPFDPKTLNESGFDGMRHVIRDVDPPRPSGLVSTLSDAVRTQVARQRSTDPSKLAASLHGDLDWIVMHCLEKERTRRYETADALAADIERHLRHDPVEAHAPNPTYLARKFIRRHRVGVVAVAAVMLSLVAGLVSSSMLFLRERAAKARATALERTEASLRRDADRAREAETIRASLTARDLAEQHLAQGHTADGLAWLVHAARKNPGDITIGPRIASALAAHTFLMPAGAPWRFPARVMNVRYLDGARKIGVYCADGTVSVIDAASGAEVRTKLPSGLAQSGVLLHGRVTVLLGQDDVVRVLDPATAHLEREIRFERKIARISVRRSEDPVVLVVLDDGSFLVAEAATGRIRKLPLSFTSTTEALLTNDGRWMLVKDGGDGTLALWDTVEGRQQGDAIPGQQFTAMAFSPSGDRLVLSGFEGNRYVFTVRAVPDLAVLVPLSPLSDRHAGSAVLVIAFSPDGRLYSIGSQYGYQVYDAATSAPVGPYRRGAPMMISVPMEGSRQLAGVDGPGSAFRGAVFFGRSDRLRVVTIDRPGLAIRDATTGNEVLPPLTYENGVNPNVCISEDGSTLLGFGGDRTMLVWDLATGRKRAEPHPRPAELTFDVALAPDGSEVVIGNADGIVERLRVGGAPARPLELPRAPPFMPIAFLSTPPMRLYWPRADHAWIVDTAGGHVTSTAVFPASAVGLARSLLGIAIRRDGRFMVVRTAAGAWQSWRLVEGAVAGSATLQDAPGPNSWVCFSPATDDVAIVTNEPEPYIRVWDLATGRPRNEAILGGSPRGIGELRRPTCFSNDGRQLLEAGRDGVVHIRAVSTGHSVAELPPQRPGGMTSVDVSRDGTRFVTSTILSETQIWDAATHRPVGARILAPRAVFSPDGSHVLTSGGNMTQVWDSATGAAMSAPMVHVGTGVRWAAFSNDGQRVVTAAQDGMSRIWDARTGRPLSEPLEHPSPRLVSCEFSPDGRFVRTEVAAESNRQTEFFVWSVPPDTQGQAAPEWLLQLATVCAGKRIDMAGQAVEGPETLARIDEIRRLVATLPDGAPFVRWGRWLLDERPDRPIGPEFSVSAADAELLAARLAENKP
jgi:WD40 repeat protein